MAEAGGGEVAIDFEQLDAAITYSALLGWMIARYRNVKRLTRDEIAAFMGISAQQYALIETGRSDVTLRQLKQIGELIKTDEQILPSTFIGEAEAFICILRTYGVLVTNDLAEEGMDPAVLSLLSMLSY